MLCNKTRHRPSRTTYVVRKVDCTLNGVMYYVMWSYYETYTFRAFHGKMPFEKIVVIRRSGSPELGTREEENCPTETSMNYWYGYPCGRVVSLHTHPRHPSCYRENEKILMSALYLCPENRNTFEGFMVISFNSRVSRRIAPAAAVPSDMFGRCSIGARCSFS